MDHGGLNRQTPQLPRFMQPRLDIRERKHPWDIKCCSTCGNLIEHYDDNMTHYPRCPGCHRISEEEHRQHVRENSNRCFCVYHTVGPGTWCACPCVCVDDDDEEEDRNYGPKESKSPQSQFLNEESAEQSDEDQPDIGVYGKHTRRYGHRIAGIKDNAKCIWYESQTHYHAATGHDHGRLEESSFANSENYISQKEVHDIHQELQPSEIECAMRALNLTLKQISHLFPEAWKYCSLPTNTVPVICCRRCNKTLSSETRRAVQNCQLQVCSTCLAVIRPRNTCNDPDFANRMSFSFYGLEICRCRCECIESVPLDNTSTFSEQQTGYWQDREADLADSHRDEDDCEDTATEIISDDAPTNISIPQLHESGAEMSHSGTLLHHEIPEAPAALLRSNNEETIEEDLTYSNFQPLTRIIARLQREITQGDTDTAIGICQDLIDRFPTMRQPLALLLSSLDCM